MSDVKSKNLYELLGNTSDQDSDREPDPPTKAVDKPTDRHGKRDAPKAAPAAPVANAVETQGGQRGGRRGGGFNSSEAAFRDRATGRTYNRDKPTGENEDGVVRGRDSGPGTQRRGRGQRGPRRGGDRRDRTGQTEHQKQTDQAWGGNTGEGEWADERAGEKIATEEIKEGGFDATAEAPVNADGNAPGAAEPEPEDTNKSYADYLAEQAAKKLSDLGLREARAPNEGSKENKKWQSAKELAKDNDEEAYFVGEAKAHRERERATKKEYVNIDYTFKEPPREGGRGGRGGGGRGAGRGGRGRGSYEGGRGNFEGGRGRGDGAPRGRGRGRGEAPNVAVNDESAFPSLGGK